MFRLPVWPVPNTDNDSDLETAREPLPPPSPSQQQHAASPLSLGLNCHHYYYLFQPALHPSVCLLLVAHLKISNPTANHSRPRKRPRPPGDTHQPFSRGPVGLPSAASATHHPTVYGVGTGGRKKNPSPCPRATERLRKDETDKASPSSTSTLPCASRGVLEGHPAPARSRQPQVPDRPNDGPDQNKCSSSR